VALAGALQFDRLGSLSRGRPSYSPPSRPSLRSDRFRITHTLALYKIPNTVPPIMASRCFRPLGVPSTKDG
jgi:hypothetical protein